MNVIGCAAQMQMGKTTVANYLVERLGWWEKASFANRVKQVYCNTFGVDMDFIEKWKTNPEPPPGFQKPVRQSLQFIGDGFREIKYNVWVDFVFNQNLPEIVVDDVRYLNELKAIKAEKGYNVLIYRPGKDNDDPNGSEAQIKPILDWYKENVGKTSVVSGLFKNMSHLKLTPIGVNDIDFYLVNDGSVENLHYQIDELLVPDARKYFNE